MTVVRGKTRFPEYVEIIADVGIRGDGLRLLEQFTPEEIEDIRMEVGLRTSSRKTWLYRPDHATREFLSFSASSNRGGTDRALIYSDDWRRRGWNEPCGVDFYKRKTESKSEIGESSPS